MKIKALLSSAVLLAGAFCVQVPPPELRIGLMVWPAYELFYLARDRGWYQDSIQLVEFGSPVEATRAFQNGAIDAVAVTAQYSLQLFEDGFDHRIVMLIDYSSGGDCLIAKPEIESLQGLRGRRVGLQSGGLGVHMLLRALQKGGLTTDDIVPVLVDLGDHLGAFGTAVDAIVTYEPNRSRLLARGGRELFSSREIPGEIMDILLASSEAVRRMRPELQTVVRGWFAAREYLGASPEDAARIMGRREGVSPQDFLSSLSGVTLLDREENCRGLVHDRSGLADTLGQIRLVRLEANPGKHPRLEDLLEASIIEEMCP